MNWYKLQQSQSVGLNNYYSVYAHKWRCCTSSFNCFHLFPSQKRQGQRKGLSPWSLQVQSLFFNIGWPWISQSLCDEHIHLISVSSPTFFPFNSSQKIPAKDQGHFLSINLVHVQWHLTEFPDEMQNTQINWISHEQWILLKYKYSQRSCIFYLLNVTTLHFVLLNTSVSGFPTLTWLQHFNHPLWGAFCTSNGPSWSMEPKG